MNIHGEMENVLNIVIKISLVSEKKSKNKWEYRTCSTNEDTIQYYNTPYHFFNEINIQSEISEHGLMNLNRNTPILLFSKLYSYHSNNYKVLKDVLSKKADKNGKYIINQLFTEFHKIHKTNKDDNFYFAIIGMEYIVPEYVVYCDIVKPIINDIKSYQGNENIHKYDSMSLAKFSVRLKTIYNIARYELLRIAVDTGYSQGDYHTENLLLYEDIQEIMVIDFGNAKTIPHYTHLKNNWEYLEENKFVINKDTFRILKEILCDIYK
jgi:serine/threonine protein kinase